MSKIQHRSHETDWLRSLADLALLFLMAVMMLRAFLMEGYLISTGSMAPGLLGLHKRVSCPECNFEFAFGVAFDESAEESSPRLSRDYATCPNCGQSHIAVAEVPANHGDQLLVHKGVFDFRNPRRWESIVFRNPADPGAAYVKRIIGLPNDELQILNGDVWVNGEIARKSLDTVRDFRIPVFDISHSPHSTEWRMPWQPVGNWSMDQGVLRCVTNDEPGVVPEDVVNSLRFRNWRRSGGTHVVETPLPDEDAVKDWQTCLKNLQDRPVSWLTKLQFDAKRQVLRVHGVLPQEMQDQLIADATSDSFRNAVYRLGALSHGAPVTDRYGYNSTVGVGEFPVHDFQIEMMCRWAEPPKGFEIAIPIDNRVFRFCVDVNTLQARLFEEGLNAPLAEQDISASHGEITASKQLHLEFSNFDHRLICVLNQKVVFPVLDLPPVAGVKDIGSGFDAEIRAKQTAESVERQSQMEIVVRGGACSFPVLKLYRDVYYTPGSGRNAIEEPLKVPADSYFVQGDNSPVSSDSRNWADPCVPHHLLIGKPFVVHLPSRPGKLSVAGWELPIRIPDIDRIRYIQ